MDRAPIRVVDSLKSDRLRSRDEPNSTEFPSGVLNPVPFLCVGYRLASLSVRQSFLGTDGVEC